MKKLMFFLVFNACIDVGMAQTDLSLPETGRYDTAFARALLQKSKEQRVGAALFGLGGVVFLIIGYRAFLENTFGSGNGGGHDFLLALGGLSLIAGLPLAHAARNNQRRAAIILRSGHIPVGYKYNLPVSGLGVRITLSR